MTATPLDTFMQLFAGSRKAFGQWNPETGKMFTAKGAVSKEAFEKHLIGKSGIGLIPVTDNNKSWFGAIDIDAHGDKPDIDLIALEKKVKENKLPLMVCRSKSGGAHLYLFCAEAVMPTTLRNYLDNAKLKLGLPENTEVFPKQNTVKEGSFGNWINLPYFNSIKTERYCIADSKQQTLEMFLAIAMSKRIMERDLKDNLIQVSFDDGPPCLQKLYASRSIKEGGRDDTAQQFAVFFKRKHKGEWIGKLGALLHAGIFKGGNFGDDDIKKIENSVAKTDYAYACDTIRAHHGQPICDKPLCLMRQYGIRKEDDFPVPEIVKLVKILTEPASWILHLKVGADVKPIGDITTDSLLSFPKVRAAILERLDFLMPTFTTSLWQQTLRKLLENCEKIEAPNEAGPCGLIEVRLQEYLARNTDDTEPDPNDYAMIENGPIKIKTKKGNMMAFQIPNFIDYLKKTRSEELKGRKLYLCLRKIGANQHSLRVAEKSVISCWILPLSFIGNDISEIKPKEFEGDY